MGKKKLKILSSRWLISGLNSSLTASSDPLASLPGLFLEEIPWRFCLGMFLWKWCEAGVALTLSNTDFWPIFGSSWHSCIPFSSFIRPGGDRGRCPGCQLPAGRAEDEQVADLLLWGAGECRNLGKSPWTGIPQSWSCHICILLAKKELENIHRLGMELSGNSWLLPNLVITNRARNIKPEQIQPWCPCEFPIFPGILIICNFCQYFQCTPSSYPTPKIYSWFTRIDFSYLGFGNSFGSDFFSPKMF